MGPARNRDKADNRLAARNNKGGNRSDSSADSDAARSSLSLSTCRVALRQLSAKPRRPDQSPPVRPAPALPQRPQLRSMSSWHAPHDSSARRQRTAGAPGFMRHHGAQKTSGPVSLTRKENSAPDITSGANGANAGDDASGASALRWWSPASSRPGPPRRRQGCSATAPGHARPERPARAMRRRRQAPEP